MRICGVDFEATGVDPKTARIIEIGAVFGDPENPTCFSRLVWHSGYPLLTSEVKKITGLTDEQLASEGAGPVKSLEMLTAFLNLSDAIFAHNKAYDETLYKAECERLGITPSETPWYCTMSEVPYPEEYKCRKLSHLALDHGITVDPSTLHRAVDDVKLMLITLAKGGYTPERIIEYAKSEWVYMKAMIPPPWEDGGVGKERARKAGYSWERAKGTEDPTFPKTWVKRVKMVDLENEKSQDPGFKREIIKQK